jgi:hydrogenase maturation protease
MSLEKILIVGLGNPILGDDRVGWAVVEEVEKRIDITGVDFAYLSVGGIRLMEYLVGYDIVILVDAILTKTGKPGAVYCFPLDELPDPTAGHTTSVHDTSLPTALEMGKLMDVHLPDEVQVIAIESKNVLDFTEQLTEDVESSIPIAVEKVLEVLRGYLL